MVLFVSDMHFGSGPDRESELSLIRCLRTHQESLQHLILGGDVFDAFIEYRTLVPKGFVRLMGCLADLADEGVRISYILGNHDCWHLDYFQSELGVQVCPGTLTFDWHGLRVYAEHGDAVSGTSPLRRATKMLLRNRVLGLLYRTLMPGDFGMRLAQSVKRRLDARGESPHTAGILREHARSVLDNHPCDLVIMGHSHRVELHSWPVGTYINAGSWRDGANYVVLTDGQLQLRRWDRHTFEILDSVQFQPGVHTASN